MMPCANMKGKTLEGREKPFMHVWCYRLCENTNGVERLATGSEIGRYSNRAYRLTSGARLSGITIRILARLRGGRHKVFWMGPIETFYGDVNTARCARLPWLR